MSVALVASILLLSISNLVEAAPLPDTSSAVGLDSSDVSPSPRLSSRDSVIKTTTTVLDSAGQIVNQDVKMGPATDGASKAATPQSAKPAPAGSDASSPASSPASSTGDLTFFHQGAKGSCGSASVDSDHIAALSKDDMEEGTCGKCALVKYQSKSIQVRIVDTCEGCASGDMDLSPSAFNALGHTSTGRLHAASWSFVDC